MAFQLFIRINALFVQRLGGCRGGGLRAFQTAKIQEDFPLSFLEFEKPGAGHSRVSLRRHGIARPAQEGFDGGHRLLGFFQLLVVGDHNATSMTPRTLPSRVVSRQSKTLSKFAAAPDITSLADPTGPGPGERTRPTVPS